MVAELAGISTSTIDGSASLTVAGACSKQRGRPKWIQTATREPIYSILDSSETVVQTCPSALLGKVVVIRAVGKNESRWEKLESKTLRDEQQQRELSLRLEAEDDDALYSVVRKSKKVRLPGIASSSSREAIRPVDQTRIGIGEKPQPEPEDASKRIRVRKWLHDAPVMYSGRTDYENPWPDREAASALPKGAVGLVGPYRVYRNPNERREYMLQEEELVEETVRDKSVDEHRSRAKWRIREDDQETLVPDIRELPGCLEGFVETKMVDEERESDDWNNRRESPVKSGEKSKCVGGTWSGEEERPIDAPADTVSATTSMKGERKLASRQLHVTFLTFFKLRDRLKRRLKMLSATNVLTIWY